MADASVTIIGGGVVGLAIAAELARRTPPVFVLERNDRYGQETSSRNSEVIHAGMYYATGSLKARLCVEGNRLLYDICQKAGVPHERITKVITATRPEEERELQRIHALGVANGVTLKMLSAAEVHALEPAIVSVGGLFSPNTGIISAHGLMDYFYRTAKEGGAEVQTHCTVVGLERHADGFRITIQEGTERSSFTSERVINAAGLESDTIAALAGIDVDKAGYRIHYSRGCYFSIPASMSGCVKRLVYPVPTNETLGVHAVVDLGGRLKFGPDIEYLPDRRLDYRVDEKKRHAFGASVRRILPHIKDEDLTPEMSGIRPKLQRAGEPARDFVIQEESGRGLPGLINLIGIESPGLTASPAIARHVAAML
ncbi:MAG TPA: NAD(P)/FAD-dependent oxidoreductase [Bacteroidota bacterium]|nr:NAD(P)/FAD-dependent oxidoreductase [Bacteroidota bacterium]